MKHSDSCLSNYVSTTRRPCKQLKYYHRRVARVPIASAFTESEQKVQEGDHAEWESENFDQKLHSRKEINIQLIQRQEHEHKDGFVS